ncbi:MAG: phage tail tape measure protein [Desulfovibrio sp.]|nr:phage tail tape measure protein [Desulfovibrio sp.]
MAREVAITFALNAALKGGYKAAFQGAASQARNVASALRQMERTPVGKLGAAMATQREKIKGLSGSLKEARQSLASLNAQAAGGGTAMLGRQIEIATTRVKSLEGALNRQLGAWRNTTAQAATASGSVSRLARDYEKLSQKMERARKASQALHANRAQAEALRAQRSDLNSRLTGAVATAATVAVPMKLSVGFEDAIARVGAVANASDEDMARLTATARQLGRDTVFSASQAAEGMQYLSMAGFDANETIAAMPGMLDLAAAGNTDLGRTADIASDILSAFKLKAEDMGQVSDTLAKTFTTSNTSLEMLGDTMKYVGPVAASVGMSLQDTSAMAGMLGNVGIKASQAGTVLRAGLLRLAAPRKMARDTLGQLAGVEGEELDKLAQEMDGADEALKELGMTTKDEAGNLRPMVDILEELNARTAKMGSGDKAEVFARVFGSEASAGMTALAEQAAVTVDKHGKQITNSLGQPTNALRAYMEKVNDYEGTGARIAKRMNETTGGALRRLKSAWEDVGIIVGNLFLPAISAVADGLSAVGNVISGAVERFPVLSRVIGVTAGAFGALFAASVVYGLIANTLKTGLNGLRGAFLRVAAGQAVSAAATTVAGGAFSLAGAAARFFAGGLRSILMATGVGAALVAIGYVLALLIDNWDEVREAAGKCWAHVKDWAAGAFECVTGIWKDLALIFDGIVAGVRAIFGSFFDWLRENFSWIFSAIDAAGSVVGHVTGTIGRAWDKIFGDGEPPAEAAQKSAPAAAAAQEAPAAAAAAPASFTPVSASAVNGGAATATGKGKGKGRRAGSGAGSGGGSTAGSASGSSGGPVTVVTLAGDNSAPQTLFFPAGGGGASMPAAAAAQASQVARALPQAPELAKAAMRGAAKASSPASGSVTVDLTQHFDLIADDARAVRKVLETIKPDMEALVRRALEKLQSDRRRTAYAQ